MTDLQSRQQRFFRIAGITVCVTGNLDFDKIKFKDELMTFAVDGPGDDNIVFTHHFELPDLAGQDLGKEVYRKPPWAISLKDGTWCYKGILVHQHEETLYQLAFFNTDHTRATIYNPPFQKDILYTEGFQSLSLFPTDQIWIGPLLSDRNAMLLHSAAAVINGQGFLFVGHSDSGKTTTIEMLQSAQHARGLQVETLCDDRNVLRKWSNGWRVHGTWSHGDISDVSSADAPLHGIFFLEQATTNELIPLNDRKSIWRRLLATLIRPMVTAEWWKKELDILDCLVNEIPCYTMRFDKTGNIIDELEKLIG